MTILTQCCAVQQNDNQEPQGTTYTAKSKNEQQLQLEKNNSSLSTLDLQERAIEHGKRGQFKHAQVCATRLINSSASPMDLQGYLLSGDLYYYQGYQSSAMEIYKQGINQYCTATSITMTEKVSNHYYQNKRESDTYFSQEYQLLCDHYQIAKVTREKRIDFVNALACTDVTALIFNHLLTKEKTYDVNLDTAVLEATRVCKSWRDFMLFQVPTLWRDASCWGFMKRINPTFRFLLHSSGISHHVRHLALTDISLNICNTLIELSRDEKLNNVKGIKYVTGTEVQKELDMSITFILSLNKNLTTLFFNEIHVVQEIDDPGLPLKNILSTCRSLQHLSIITNRSISYEITSNNNSDESSLTPAVTKITHDDDYCYKLRTLVIRCRGTLDRALGDIVSRSPKLQTFSTANGCSSSTMLNQLDQSCPNLRQFFITPEPHEKIKLDEIMDDDDHNNIDINYNNGKKGLEILGLDQLVVFEPRDLMPFFQKNQNTLQALELEFGAPQETKVQDWSPLAHMGPFPNIKRLYYSSSDKLGEDDPIAVPLIERCPALEIVEFEYIDQVTLQAIHSLMALRHLRHLIITNSAISHTIQAFFEHHARLGYGSSLEKVSLVYAHPLTDAILDALGGIMTLKKIIIQGSSRGVTQQGVEAFIKKYASHSNVENIQLSQLRQVPFFEINQMLSAYNKSSLPPSN